MTETKPMPTPPWRLHKDKGRYVNAANTDVAKTWARYGWVAPSVLKQKSPA